MTMETVAFYSYKGGVGRTLLVANTAQFLAMCGRRVAVLDLDLEAPGLHQKLGNKNITGRAQMGKLTGAVNELLRILKGQSKAGTLAKTAIEIELASNTKGQLYLIPAGSAPSLPYWAALDELHNAVHSRRNGGLLEAVLELQARIQEELAPEFLLIDSRTGITELGGFATSVLADRVICMTTTAPESVDGTRVVAEALRTAPRLSSQKPLRIDFLITRVVGSRNTPSVSRLINEFGESVSILPHDSAIANEERVLVGWDSGRSAKSEDDDDPAGKELFSATLKWIAESFPVHKADAETARRRMEAVYRAWQFLTKTSERVRGGTASRTAWPVEQLRERVRFEKAKKWREADIVAYDKPTDSKTARPLMIIEYVEGEDRDKVARWWLEETPVPVVAILSDNSERRLYSERARWDSRAHHSDRWDLPMPHDFVALSDPTDVSVEALLDAVRRGHPEYLDRIVTEWVHCSASGLHGGAPWKPEIAKKIIDGLARVDDVELAKRVLWATSPHPFRRERWIGDGDEWLEDQVHTELFTPLLWRLPPEASIELIREGHRGRMMHGRPAGLLSVSLLARDLLGLYYEPDSTFRIEADQVLNQSKNLSTLDRDRGIYGLTSAFKQLEISFEMSTDLPALASVEISDDREHAKPMSLSRLVSEQIANRTLVTTGLLGDYEPRESRVVLYHKAISICADKLALRPRHVGSVTLIHETIHALIHRARDLDGREWVEFALPSASDIVFEPSWFHETLTQYFTYRQILKLHDSEMLHAFETMSAKQAPVYRNWQELRNLSIEDARCWLMSVRRGVGNVGLSSHMLLSNRRNSQS